MRPRSQAMAPATTACREALNATGGSPRSERSVPVPVFLMTPGGVRREPEEIERGESP